jgi:hypothetical protein
MEFFRRHRLLSFALLCPLLFLLVGKIVWPLGLAAQQSALGQLNQQGSTNSQQPTGDSGGLGSEIDFFLGSQGAAGYIVWQYSGSRIFPLGNDQYSFWEGDSAVCDILKQKAAQYSGKFIGVNMWDIAAHPDGDHLDRALNYLQGCGVNMIRISGRPGIADPIGQSEAQAVKTVIEKAGAHGMKVIVWGYDFPNIVAPANAGNIAGWYKKSAASGSEYMTYITKLASDLKGTPNLYAFEFMSEAHCGGDPGCVEPYMTWAHTTAAAVKGIFGPGVMVSIGQAAESDIGLGDSPKPGDYAKSNNVPDIDMVSGHYYDNDQRNVNIEAAAVAKTINKPFYIGEAPPITNVKLDDAPYFEYNIQRSNPQRILSNFYDEYSVACMPKEEYRIVGSTKKCEKLENGGCLDWNLTGELSISADHKLFGLFRNEQKVAARALTNTDSNNRLESLEAYLGTRNPNAVSSKGVSTGLVSASPIKDVSSLQAPLFKLTTLKQQCLLIKNKLRAVKELCKPENRIEGDTTACALDTTIPGTGYTQTGLLSAIEGTTCERLMNPKPGEEQLKETVLSVPLTMELAYRPAFIVAITKFDGQLQRNDPNQNVSVTSQDKTDPDHFYVIDYLEVKVPAFGSDIIPPDAPNISNPEKNNPSRDAYRDPLLSTADVLRSTEDQAKVKKEEVDDRNAVRKQGGNDVKIRGEFVGKNGEPIYCYHDGKLGSCDTDATDKIPSALLAFINANSAIGDKAGLPCEANEADFYDDENKRLIAEQVKQIGSDLQAREKVGDYTKKREASVKISIDIKDVRKSMGVGVHTQLYFVSPHGYALKYARDSFYNFLTLDQQAQLKSMGLLTSTGALDPEAFSPQLKTPIDDKVNGPETQRGGYDDELAAAAPAPAPGESPAPRPGFFIDALKIVPETDNDKAKNHPLIWEVAGQVANLPTRLMALVTTAPGHPVNEYTLSCTNKEKPNEFATEDWLLGRCKAGTPPDPTGLEPNVCAVPDSTRTHSEAINGTSTVSDGVIALALEVSKRTCTPPEILIGILAKESKGMNYHGAGQPETVDTGDPNELICRTAACVSNSGGIYGAYSYTQGDFLAHASHGQIAPLYNDCINGLSVKLKDGVKTLTVSPDSRALGHAMCVMSADFWRYMLVWKQKPACTGADKKMYELKDIDPAILDKYLGVHCAPGWDDPTSANYKYHDFCAGAVVSFDESIKLFSDDVAALKGVCTANTSAP